MSPVKPVPPVNPVIPVSPVKPVKPVSPVKPAQHQHMFMALQFTCLTYPHLAAKRDVCQHL